MGEPISRQFCPHWHCVLAITVRAYFSGFHVQTLSAATILSVSHHPCERVGSFAAVCTSYALSIPPRRLSKHAMIINQESHARKTQLDPERDAPVVTSSTPLIPAESPPAYTPREDPAPSSSSTLPLHNSPPPPITQKGAQDRAAQRFFNALLLAFGLYAGIAFVFKSLFFMMRGPRHGGGVRFIPHSFSTGTSR